MEIREEVDSIVRIEKGDHINAHASEFVAARLMDEAKRLPMWGNIYNRKFDCTNVEANSSASVECEIRKVKRGVLNSKGKTLRVDVSVTKIIKYYDGKLRFLKNCDESNNEDEDRNPNQTNVTSSESAKNISDSMKSQRPKKIKTEPHDNNSESAYSKYESYTKRDSVTRSLQTPEAHVTLSDSETCQTALVSGTLPQNIKIKEEKITEPVNGKCTSCRKEDSDATGLCRICKCKIHATSDCSIVPSNATGETHKQQRVCLPCFNQGDIDAKLSLTETENHKGLPMKDEIASDKRQIKDESITKKKRKNLYLGGSKQKISDMLHYQSTPNRIKPLALLKNGNNDKLAFITIGNCKVSLKNTCALDSLFQIYLAMATDCEKFREYLQNIYDDSPGCAQNLFIRMILETLSKNVRQLIYLLRAELMLKYLGINLKPGTTNEIECATGIHDLANYILKYQPSMTIQGQCKKKCTAAFVDESPTKLLEIFHLHKKNFSNILKNQFMKSKLCVECNTRFEVNAICCKYNYYHYYKL